MEVSNALNIIGLAFDILGIILLYFFGLSAGISGVDDSVVTWPDPAGKSSYKWKKTLSRVGLWSIIIGFLFQIAANYVF